MVEAARGRRVGRRARAAARRGPARPGDRASTCRCPRSLSATALARLRDDPDAFARDLARPMPRPPSPAARFGTRFHAWVEARFGQQDLFDPDELPGRADAGIDDDADLARADRGRSRPARSPTGVPHAVEAPFALVLAGQVVRGRIDAVYAEPVDGGTASWSWTGRPTGRRPPTRSSSRSTGWPGPSSPGVPVERVRAAFYYVRTGELVEPTTCPTGPSSSALVARRLTPLTS